MGGCVMGGCVSLFYQFRKREIDDKGEDLCQAWRNVRGVLWSFVMKRDGEECGGGVGGGVGRGVGGRPLRKNAKELQEKSAFLKISAQAFGAGDFLNIFLRF